MTHVTLRLGQALGAVFAVAGMCVAAAIAAGSERSSTGEIVFAADRMPAVFGEIYRVGPDGRRTNLSRSPYEDLQPLVSPNGKKVAFVSERGGGQALYVVGIDGRGLTRVSSPQRLSSSSGLMGSLFAWAPDNERLAAVTGRSEALYVLQPGRSERLIGRRYWEPAWSPDGRVITVTRLPAHGGARTYVQAFSSEGTPLWRVARQGDTSWSALGRFAVVSPGGMIRIYDAAGTAMGGFAGRAFAWSGSGGRLASVTGHRLEVRSDDGRQLVFSITVPGLAANQYNGLKWANAHRVVIEGVQSSVIGVDVSTGKIWHVKGYFGVFPAGGELVSTKVGNSFALQIAPFGGSASRMVARLPGCWDDLGFVAAAEYLQFTPDGRSLVYQSSCAEPFSNLYAVNSDGTGLHRLTRVNEEESSPQVSPDGSRIAYSRSDYRGASCKGCPTAIWVRNVDGSSPRRITPTRVDTWDTNPRWSPDSRKILFSRGRLTSAGEFVVSAKGGVAREIASARGPKWGPTWSRDGRMASVERGGHGIVVSAAGGGATQHIRLPLAYVGSIAWSPDGRGFVLTARVDTTAPTDVFTVDADGRHLKRLTWNLNASSASRRP